MKSSPLIWWLLHTVKLTVKILSIFVAFSENMNFKQIAKFITEFAEYFTWFFKDSQENSTEAQTVV